MLDMELGGLHVLHQEHQRDARHKAPVDDPSRLFVECLHLALTEAAECLKAMLNLGWGVADSVGVLNFHVGAFEMRLLLDSGRHGGSENSSGD